MKKSISLALSIVLVLVLPICAAQAEEGAKFVTIQEWLDAEGECGDCMLLMKITQILNPVLAVAADDTGTVNLFSGNGEDSMIINFMSDECPQDGAILVIANPRFNEFEGTIEMADWTLLKIMRDPVCLMTSCEEETNVNPTEDSFTYTHDPRENPEAMADIIENADAVYGFSPDPASQRLGTYAEYDWTDPEFVQRAQAERREYHESMESMTDILYEMRESGASIEEMARAVSAERNRLRLESYRDDPEGLESVKESNLKTYGHEDGPTPDQLFEKYGSWTAVMQKAFSPNMGMDACCGLYDEYYWLYIELGYVES